MTPAQFAHDVLTAPETAMLWEGPDGSIELADELEKLLPRTFLVARDLVGQKVVVSRLPRVPRIDRS